MHCIRSSVLQHLRLRVSVDNVRKSIGKMNFTSGDNGGQDQILSKVIELVKKYDKTNASKVKLKLLLLFLFYFVR